MKEDTARTGNEKENELNSAPDRSSRKNRKKKKASAGKSPVIRKLRIEFIIVMMAIVVVFLAVIFGVQYFTTRRSMENETRETLSNALSEVILFRNGIGNIFIDDDFPENIFPDGSLPEEGSSDENDPSGDSGNVRNPSQDGSGGFGRRNPGMNLSDFRDRRSRTAVLVAVIEPNRSVVIRQNNIFFIAQEDVESLIQTVLDSKEETGRIEDHSLQYMKRSLSNGSTALALVDVSSEMALLRSELIRSIWISLAVIVAMFLLSLVLSKLTIRPVEKAWEDQRRFVADASHELKTPLTVIMSNTDMVQRSLKKLLEETEGQEPSGGGDTAGQASEGEGSPSNPDSRRGNELRETSSDDRRISVRKLERNLRRMDNVSEESLRMKELIGELLEVARGDVGQNMAEFQQVSLSEVVTDAQITWESVYFEQGKILTGNIEEGLTMNGDRTTLRRLVEILVDNALKYSRDRSEVRLTLKREKTGSKKNLHISVANEGTPLTEEEISHLFDRFYRADSSREKTAGYGLGLSIAQSIAAAHKGRIWAEADGTKGNVFHVTFPG